MNKAFSYLLKINKNTNKVIADYSHTCIIKVLYHSHPLQQKKYYRRLLTEDCSNHSARLKLAQYWLLIGLTCNGSKDDAELVQMIEQACVVYLQDAKQ